MKKFDFNNKLDWRNNLRNELKGLGIDHATKICERRGYTMMFNEDDMSRIEYVKFAAGVAYQMIVLLFSPKGRVRDIEFWQA